MAITAAEFPSYLGVAVPSGSAEYVVPSANIASVPVAATDDWFGYVRETLGSVVFNPQDPSTFGVGNVAGYQQVTVGGAKVAADSSGLSGATVYTASVLIDGVTTIALSVVGSTVTTYGVLMTKLTQQLNNFATCALVGGNVRITSKKTGSVSAIAITDGTLFAALTGYSAIASAVPGVTLFTGMGFHKDDGGTDSVVVVADSSTYDTPLNSTLSGYTPA